MPVTGTVHSPAHRKLDPCRNNCWFGPAKARNKVTALPHGTSLLDVRSKLPDKKKIATKNGLRIYSLPAALVDCGPHKYQQNPTDMRTALAMIKDASELLEILLDGGHSSIAGRLAGAFRNTGQAQIADEIVQTMQSSQLRCARNGPICRTIGPGLFSARAIALRLPHSPDVAGNAGKL